jgi:hypothetical protein
MFDTKLNFITLLSDLKFDLKNPGSVRLNDHEHKLILVPGWSGRWWRDRPRTDPSSVSDLGTGLGFSSSNELISARLYRDSFVQLRDSQFQLDQLIETLFGSGPDFVSGIVSSIVSSLVSRLIYSTWT